MDNVGVFLCTGCGIGEGIDPSGFEDLAREHGAKSLVSNSCLCSPESVAEMRSAVDGGLDGMVIAACSHRAKLEEFRFDPTKVAVERVSLREQCVWSHEAGHEDTQMLANDLLIMGVVRAKKMELATRLDESIDDTVLVVGGGLAGLEAAWAAAGMGHPVVIVEKQAALGGYLATVKDLVPEEPPYDQLHENRIADMIAAVTGHGAITVHTSTTVEKITGQPGQFDVELSSGATFRAGAIVQATGARPYDATRLGHLGYGESPDVITSQDMEAMILKGELARPSDGKKPERIAFVQCAGSRDPDHLPYCSSECCATTLKQVAAIHRDFGDVSCAVLYRDLRAPGQLEHFYASVQELPGSMFTRGTVDKVSASGKRLELTVSDSLLGEEVTLDADLVVLALGMVPSSADGEAIRVLEEAKVRAAKGDSEKQKKEAAKLVEEYKEHDGTEILNLGYRQGPDLPVLRYKFPDSHYICFPYETRRTGIYAAGTLHAPMDAAQASEDAWGAAMKAVQNIESNKRGEAVHPRAGDVSVASFFLQRCTQCKRCTEECPFGTLNEDAKGTPQYNALRCRRCGICMGCCPERIISFPEYSPDQVGSMIKALEIPEEEEEKPRTIAFMCENDALPALDEAARRGMTWNSWVRIIPVRCLGAVNVIWIADALSNGYDGIMLMGCRKGTDYQCHYIRGSELAEKRLENVKETLDRLALEPERIKVLEVARDDFARIPELFDEFAEEIDEMGPNPMKGF